VRVPLPFTLGAAIALVVLAACGGNAATQPPAGGTPPAGATATATAAAIECGAAGTGTAATIANFAFAPNPVTVSSGGTITWTNNDSTAHTVTFDSGPDCKNVAAAASVTVKFNAPGSYPYHCTIHSSMKGTVTVNG
jgi:plastocyanin